MLRFYDINISIGFTLLPLSFHSPSTRAEENSAQVGRGKNFRDSEKTAVLIKIQAMKTIELRLLSVDSLAGSNCSTLLKEISEQERFGAANLKTQFEWHLTSINISDRWAYWTSITSTRRASNINEEGKKIGNIKLITPDWTVLIDYNRSRAFFTHQAGPSEMSVWQLDWLPLLSAKTSRWGSWKWTRN